VTDEEAFLDAIQEKPTDGTSRLVYADWLQEQSRHEEEAIVRSEAEIARAERDPYDVWLFETAERKFAYKGWWRKYPQRWVSAVSATPAGEVLFLKESGDGECETSRFLLVTGAIGRRLRVATVGVSTWCPGKPPRPGVWSLIDQHRRWLTVNLATGGWLAEPTEGLIPGYVFNEQVWIFWDGKE